MLAAAGKGRRPSAPSGRPRAHKSWPAQVDLRRAGPLVRRRLPVDDRGPLCFHSDDAASIRSVVDIGTSQVLRIRPREGCAIALAGLCAHPTVQPHRGRRHDSADAAARARCDC
jgi:hypothetical protein